MEHGDSDPRPQAPGKEVVLAEGRFLRFVVREGWEFADRTGVSGIVAIVAVTDAGEIILVEQRRPPVGGPVLELPAGLVGDTPGAGGEDLFAGARRELLEETGFEAARWSVLAQGPISPGTTSEVIALVFASGLTRVSPGGGSDGEEIRVHEMPIDGAGAWLAAREAEGIQVDLKIWAGLYFATAHHARATGKQR